MKNPFSNADNAELDQSMALAVEIAEDARNRGQHEREAAAHNDLNDMIDIAQSRGWMGGQA